MIFYKLYTQLYILTPTLMVKDSWLKFCNKAKHKQLFMSELKRLLDLN